MFYTFNKKKLEYEKSKKKFLIFYSSIAFGVIAFASLILNSVAKTNEKKDIDENLVDMRYIEPEERIIILNNSDKFTEEKLKDYILELNIKFPDIAFSQARYESGNWGTNTNANLFEKNNNLFGMREAMSRATTCKGTQFKHAYYDHWRMSVVDYALWQGAYARDIKTRKEYIVYLKSVYAEGTYEAIMQILNETRNKYPELCVDTYPKLEK